jgi:hypothetical protein
MVDRAIHIGDLVKDFHLGLIWKVVDQDDDGMTYIERNDVRSFVTLWHLELVSRQRPQSISDAE